MIEHELEGAPVEEPWARWTRSAGVLIRLGQVAVLWSAVHPALVRSDDLWSEGYAVQGTVTLGDLGLVLAIAIVGAVASDRLARLGWRRA